MRRSALTVSLALTATLSVASARDGPASTPGNGLSPAGAVVATLRTRGEGFSMPSGLAYDRAGTLYVSDAARNAIFSIDPSGSVRIVAGLRTDPRAPARGSFADGLARDARFDEPMGLAVDARGDVLVADANNHCLRSIHAGIVSTLAGHCTFQDDRDGAAAAAYFRRPLALAIDRSNGDVYIADFGSGIRKLDAAGNVTSPFPNLPNTRVTGVAQSGDALLVVDTEGCTVLRLHAGTSTRYLSGAPGSALARDDIDAHDFAGFPYAAVALDEHAFALTDVTMHGLRLLSENVSRIVAGERNVDALLDGGGYRDGSAALARFDVPLAVTLDPAGRLVVADAGNHLLRVVSGFDRGDEALELPGPPVHAPPGALRIALIEGPGAGWNTEADSSVASATERALAATGRAARVVAYRARGTLEATLAGASALVVREHFSSVVLDLEAADPAALTAAETARELARFRDAPALAGVAVLIVVHPQPGEVAPWESFAAGLEAEPGSGGRAAPGASSAQFAAALENAGLPVLDLRLPMVADEFAPGHRPLYFSADARYSPDGRALTGALIAARLTPLRERAPRSESPAAPASDAAGTQAASNEPPAAAPVTTLRLQGAELTMPSGLAYDSAGTLYVADAALQAIFSVDSHGRTRPFAGPATPQSRAREGAFADGEANAARFDQPMGLAVAANGDLLVADAGNHCLRRVHAAAVSTLAGRCTIAGTRDGAAAEALFERPLALALDRANGDVYVADDGGGLRKVDAAGRVSTPFPDQPSRWVTGVALAGYNLLVIDTSGVTLRDLPDGKPLRFLSGSPPSVFAPGAFMSHEFGGFPYAAAALRPRQFVVTDVRSHGVRFLNWMRSRSIAGSNDVDAGQVGGGDVDGPGERARFDVPLAIALAPDGSFVVADAGNHVLRKLGRFDQTWNAHSAPTPEDHHFRRDEYRVALVGNSAVWWSSDMPTSTQAAIASRLAADPAFAAASLRARVVTFGLGSPSLDATVSAITEVIALEHFDTIVLELNTVQLPGPQLGAAQRDVAAWKPYVLAHLAHLRSELAADHVSLLVAVGPIFGELAPWESYAGTVDWGTGDAVVPEWDESPAALAAVVARSGVPMLDLSAPMLSEDFRLGHRPLFMALDGHYSPAGRAFVGNRVAAELIRRRYWDAARKH